MQYIRPLCKRYTLLVDCIPVSLCCTGGGVCASMPPWFLHVYDYCIVLYNIHVTWNASVMPCVVSLVKKFCFTIIPSFHTLCLSLVSIYVVNKDSKSACTPAYAVYPFPLARLAVTCTRGPVLNGSVGDLVSCYTWTGYHGVCALICVWFPNLEVPSHSMLNFVL